MGRELALLELCWEAPKPSVHHTGVVAAHTSGSCHNVTKPSLPPPKILISLLIRTGADEYAKKIFICSFLGES